LLHGRLVSITGSNDDSDVPVPVTVRFSLPSSDVNTPPL
jgi:hypothetical protein